MLATHNIQAAFCAGYEAATIHAASKGHLSVLKKHLGKRVKLLQYQWPMSHILHAVLSEVRCQVDGGLTS